MEYVLWGSLWGTISQSPVLKVLFQPERRLSHEQLSHLLVYSRGFTEVHRHRRKRAAGVGQEIQSGPCGLGRDLPRTLYRTPAMSGRGSLHAGNRASSNGNRPSSYVDVWRIERG
jgi:hypothetical protein